MLEPDNQKSRAVERLRERFRENPERAYNVTPFTRAAECNIKKSGLTLRFLHVYVLYGQASVPRSQRIANQDNL